MKEYQKPEVEYIGFVSESVATGGVTGTEKLSGDGITPPVWG